MAEPRDTCQVRRQPVFQAGQERRITDIRPVTLALSLKVQLTQQAYSGLPLTQLRRPRQQFQAFASHQIDQCLCARGFVEPRQRFATQHQLTHFALTLSAQHAFALVPIQLVDHADLLTQHIVQQRGIKLCRQVDTLFALPLAAAEVGDDQPRLLHQGIDLAEQRGPAIGQTVFGAAGLALLGDAVGIGQGQQGAEPARVLGICHRAGRFAA